MKGEQEREEVLGFFMHVPSFMFRVFDSSPVICGALK